MVAHILAQLSSWLLSVIIIDFQDRAVQRQAAYITPNSGYLEQGHKSQEMYLLFFFLRCLNVVRLGLFWFLHLSYTVFVHWKRKVGHNVSENF